MKTTVTFDAGPPCDLEHRHAARCARGKSNRTEGKHYQGKRTERLYSCLILITHEHFILGLSYSSGSQWALKMLADARVRTQSEEAMGDETCQNEGRDGEAASFILSENPSDYIVTGRLSEAIVCVR